MARSSYVCQQRGHQTGKWHGRCPSCHAWDTLVDEAAPGPRALRRTQAPTPTPFPDTATADALRTITGIAELDRVLGGGLVPGGVVLIGGEPRLGFETAIVPPSTSGVPSSGLRLLPVPHVADALRAVQVA